MRPAIITPFSETAANPEVPGYVFSFGTPARGKIVERDEKRGTAKIAHQVACLRCGGAGGSDKWIMTGWTCFDCSGTGQGPIRTDVGYGPTAYAKLLAAREKRQAKKDAAARAAEEARRAPFLEWESAHSHVLREIELHASEDLVKRIAGDRAKYVIPPEWLLDVAVVSALRTLLRSDIKAASEHVGAPGSRIDLQLSCEKLLDYSERGSNGYLIRAFYIALMRDEAGNRIVYKGGNPPLGEGQSGKFRATVKGHDERDGEKQTIIQRAKALEAEAV